MRRGSRWTKAVLRGTIAGSVMIKQGTFPKSLRVDVTVWERTFAVVWTKCYGLECTSIGCWMPKIEAPETQSIQQKSKSPNLIDDEYLKSMPRYQSRFTDVAYDFH